MMTDEEAALGLSIVTLRESSGMTQKQLAARAGIMPHTLCNIENSKRVPQRKTLQRLAEILLPGGPDTEDEECPTPNPENSSTDHRTGPESEPGVATDSPPSSTSEPNG